MEHVLVQLDVSPSKSVSLRLVPPSDPQGLCWLLVVVKPSESASSATVQVVIQSEVDDIVQRPAVVRQVAGLDWIAVPFSCADLPGRAEIAATAAVVVNAFTLHADGGLVVDVPIAMLGSGLAASLPAVNRALRELIVCSLASGDDLGAKKKGPKVYICGLGGKNKGTKCYGANLIICGKKKDKRVAEDMDPSATQDGGEYSFDPVVEAFLELIADGGSLSSQDVTEDVKEFNELGGVLRALAASDL